MTQTINTHNVNLTNYFNTATQTFYELAELYVDLSTHPDYSSCFDKEDMDALRDCAAHIVRFADALCASLDEDDLYMGMNQADIAWVLIEAACNNTGNFFYHRALINAAYAIVGA